MAGCGFPQSFKKSRKPSAKGGESFGQAFALQKHFFDNLDSHKGDDLVFANLVLIIAKLLDLGIDLYVIVIIIRAILCWFNPNPYNPGMMFLTKITDPVLERIRRLLPLGSGVGLDLSPLIAIFGLLFIKYFLVSTLYDISAGLK